MPWRGVLARSSWALVAVLLLAAAGGCRLTRSQVLMSQLPPEGPSPRELTKISLPTYVIEPPDVLLIDAVKVVPKPPYHIEPLDTLEIFVLGTLPDQSIAGPYPVEADGTIMLGPAYGAIKVSGLTLAEARDAVRTQLEGVLTAPEVSVSLSESAGQQQIEGEHLVGPDGTVNLGTYGSVYIAGMTISEARTAIEEHLKEFLDEPEVSVDVFAYNSKFYYVVTEGAGLGDQIQRVPITGNETVLDAITQVGGLSRISSKTIWVARPAPADGSGCADAARQLAGHRRRRRYLDQLADPARRSRLRRRGQAGGPGQLRRQGHRTLRTSRGLQLALLPGHPNRQPIPSRLHLRLQPRRWLALT